MLQGFFNQRVPQRAETNPLDKTTIVSIYPKDIYEYNPAIYPGTLKIKAAKPGEFVTVIIGPSSWWKEMDEGQPPLEITTSSIQMADGYIKVYCQQIGVEFGTKQPGLFFIPGTPNKSEIEKTYIKQLEKAEIQQRAFFHELVKMADTMFARTNGNPITISDDARMAANYLGMKDKIWLRDYQTMEKVPCKACGEFLNPAFPVCKHCHAINNNELATKLGIKFAAT